MSRRTWVRRLSREQHHVFIPERNVL